MPLRDLSLDTKRHLSLVVFNSQIESIYLLVTIWATTPKTNPSLRIELWYGFSKPSISRPSYPLPRTYAEYEFIEFDQYYKPKYFIDQAAPRFELGIKDLQSPALPLGHAAKKSELKSRKEEVFIHVFLRKPLLF